MRHDRQSRADGECSGKEIMTFARDRKVAKEMRRKHDEKLQHYKCPACKGWGIIYLTPDYSSGSYLLMQRAIPPQPRGGCYAR